MLIHSSGLYIVPRPQQQHHVQYDDIMCHVMTSCGSEHYVGDITWRHSGFKANYDFKASFTIEFS